MILAAAASLFRRKGFHETGIDEIGAAVGITGPGVYRHFESKQHLLASILDRTMERHQAIVAEVVAGGLPPAEALRKLVDLSAAALAADRDAAAIYFQEARSLPTASAARFTRIQRSLIREWVHLLCNARPELNEEDAHVAVRAAGGMLNSVAYFDTSMPAQRLGKLLADMTYAALLSDPNAR
jgi:AcrR family transcriptional regulator